MTQALDTLDRLPLPKRMPWPTAPAELPLKDVVPDVPAHLAGYVATHLAADLAADVAAGLATDLASDPAWDVSPEVHRQLHRVLGQLALAQARCLLLERQLRDGQQRERRQQHRADHDELTGLYNRAAFRLCAAQALEGGRAVAVILIDLDGFKQVNDQLGHAAGDQVLRVVAARMGHAVRGGDVLGRLGGDEFACLMPYQGPAAGLEGVLRQLGEAIARPMLVAGHRLRQRASLGLAVSPDDGLCVSTLLASADGQMYRAKRMARGPAA